MNTWWDGNYISEWENSYYNFIYKVNAFSLIIVGKTWDLKNDSKVHLANKYLKIIMRGVPHQKAERHQKV